MSLRLFITLFTAGSLLLAGHPAAGQDEDDSQSMDLMAIYQLAVDNDPAIAEARANRNAAKQSWPQARADILPQLSLSASYGDSTQDRFVNESGQVPLPPSESTGETTTYSLSLRQTLFDWGRFQALGRSQAEVAAAEAEYEAAMQDLVIRTAENYFDLLAALDQLASAKANERAIERQRDRAERRFEVGLVAITDVQEARAAYDQAVADRIAAERSVNLNREMMREIIGIYPGEIQAPVDDMGLQPPEPADPAAWVSRAREGNLNVAAARFNLQAAEKRLAATRAGHYPTLDLEAGYTDSESTGRTTVQGQGTTANDFRETQSTNVQVTLNIPLFNGGRVSSQTSEARSRMLAQTSAVERLQRQAERETRDAYMGVLSERSRVRALAQAVESSETALASTQAGFEVGTRTTVDVLDARRSLFEAQTSYARSKYDFLLNKLRLRAAVGSLGAQDIQEINTLLGAEPGEAIDDVQVDPEDLDTEAAQPRRNN